jgi:hypothetical protein
MYQCRTNQNLGTLIVMKAAGVKRKAAASQAAVFLLGRILINFCHLEGKIG